MLLNSMGDELVNRQPTLFRAVMHGIPERLLQPETGSPAGNFDISDASGHVFGAPHLAKIFGVHRSELPWNDGFSRLRMPVAKAQERCHIIGMNVLVENLESHSETIEEITPTYRRVGRQATAQVYLLYFDIQRLVRKDRSLTPARVAEIANLNSDWIVRDIRKPDWFVKNVAHLFQVEAALCSHPKWQPQIVYGQKMRQTDSSFVYRRWVNADGSPEFGIDVHRWRHRASDAEFIAMARTDPWVSLVDVRAERPEDYRVVSYASAMINRLGFNKTGGRLGDHPSKAYADLISSDFHKTVLSNSPRCKDVVHLYDSFNDRIVFRNVTLPCLEQGLVVSKMHIEHWEPGRLALYDANFNG